MPAYQYVFVMQNLTKVFPGGKNYLKVSPYPFCPEPKSGFWA